MAQPPMPSKVLKTFIGSEEPTTIARSAPPVSKYPNCTLPQSKRNLSLAQQKNDLNSMITMPRNLSTTSISGASVCSILVDNSLQTNTNCSDLALKRKNAMKKPYSPWRSTVGIDDTTIVQNKSTLMRRAFSTGVLQSSVFPYNPDSPLLKKFPLKKSDMTHLARARSIKTRIGPLTKEVCEQLNILLDSENHSSKVAIMYMDARCR